MINNILNRYAIIAYGTLTIIKIAIASINRTLCIRIQKFNWFFYNS